MSQPTYHGWIVVTHSPGYNDTFHVEWVENNERRQRSMSSAAEAVEWWDKRVGKPVKLVQLPVGAFRVYTGELE